MTVAIILMGVSGCGKSSVGNALSETLGWPFFDGDDFHPQANIDKMASGIPLNDTDRQPWLESLHQLIQENLDKQQSLIAACSALKAKYRQILQGDRKEEVFFVHLVGSFDLIFSRIQNRSDHYMGAEMLRSQFKALEKPINALTVSIDRSVSQIVKEIIETYNLQGEI